MAIAVRMLCTKIIMDVYSRVIKHPTFALMNAQNVKTVFKFFHANSTQAICITNRQAQRVDFRRWVLSLDREERGREEETFIIWMGGH